MDLLPAIDIRRGRVVRLNQGEPTRQTVYGDDPVATAERFLEQGARWIHVVDLDRALETGENLSTIRRLARQVGSRVRLQLGGGYRTIDLLRTGLDLGAARIVIGTAAAIDPAFMSAAAAAVEPKRLAVAIDTRDGLVARRGWSETTSLRAADLARRAVLAGIETVVYTDITRDGMLTGPDLDGAAALQGCGVQVIASGGVAGQEDIRAACQRGLAGAIVGRAIYEGRLSLPDALQAADCEPRLPGQPDPL